MTTRNITAPKAGTFLSAKTSKIVYWISAIWLALGMASTGASQLFNGKSGAGGETSIIHLGYPVYLLAILGVAKILGVLAILIPRFPLLKEWAYAGFFFMMIGAVISHIVCRDAIVQIFPSLLLLFLISTSWYFRPLDRKISYSDGHNTALSY